MLKHKIPPLLAGIYGNMINNIIFDGWRYQPFLFLIISIPFSAIFSTGYITNLDLPHKKTFAMGQAQNFVAGRAKINISFAKRAFYLPVPNLFYGG